MRKPIFNYDENDNYEMSTFIILCALLIGALAITVTSIIHTIFGISPFVIVLYILFFPIFLFGFLMLIIMTSLGAIDISFLIESDSQNKEK